MMDGLTTLTRLCTVNPGNVTMTNVTVRDNKGRFMIDQNYCNVQITHSDFTNNKGLELIRVELQSQLAFGNSHLSNNTYEKGGIFLQRSNGHVMNSTFTGNQGLNYGTLAIESSHVTTIGCKFLENTVKTKGSAVHVSGRSQYNDHSSVFAANTAREGGKILICALYKF